jgi:LmbE family N-acetylglucosaminyl deacetylase
VNAVLETSEQIIFVGEHAKSASNIVHTRRGESIGGLAFLGVDHHRQAYIAYPDTKLVKYTHPLAMLITQHAVQHGIHDYFTLGQQGFDGHPDHIATHDAATLAQQQLYMLGHPITLWALTADRSPDITKVPSVHTPKLAAIAHHQTQMPLQRDASGVLQVTDQSYWDWFVGIYGEVLFAEERYNIKPALAVKAN